MNNLLQTLASGHCCVHKFLKEQVMPYKAWQAAEFLGVTERTIGNYRRRYSENRVSICDECVRADKED